MLPEKNSQRRYAKNLYKKKPKKQETKQELMGHIPRQDINIPTNNGYFNNTWI